jgi:hypothetical protein
VKVDRLKLGRLASCALYNARADGEVSSNSRVAGGWCIW